MWEYIYPWDPYPHQLKVESESPPIPNWISKCHSLWNLRPSLLSLPLSRFVSLSLYVCIYLMHDYECMYEWFWFLILIAWEVEVLTWSWIDSFKSGALQQRSEIVSANSSFLVLARHWSISLLFSLIRSSLLQSRISFFLLFFDWFKRCCCWKMIGGFI